MKFDVGLHGNALVLWDQSVGVSELRVLQQN